MDYPSTQANEHWERHYARTSLPHAIPAAVESGDMLAGDDYTVAQISRWFEQEKEAFFTDDHGNSDVDPWYAYMRYVNERLGFARAPASGAMLVLGPGNGAEVSGFKQWILTFVEASDNFKQRLKHDFPGSAVLAPALDGEMLLPDASQDLVCCFSVLHHIPNVSSVLDEIGRVTKRGGILLVREPCSSMGDWRRERSATPNERGISKKAMLRIAQRSGFDLLCVTPIIFEPINKLLKKTIGFNFVPFWLLYLADRAISSALAWNDYYWRDSVLKKFGPSSYFYVFLKK